MSRLAGKVAAITGVGSEMGLGYAMAKAFCEQGATVFLADIDGDMATASAGRLREMGHSATARQLDITNESAWHSFLDPVVAKFGRIDVLVNNAGISKRAPVAMMDLSVWKEVIDVNLTGAFLGCQLALRTMREQSGGGSIINIASISALAAFPASCAYGASKSGVRQLSKVVALEGADRAVRCNTIFPGMIATDLLGELERTSPDQLAVQISRVPLGRLGRPEDIAACAIFLASDEATYMTGAEIAIDGGYIAQ